MRASEELSARLQMWLGAVVMLLGVLYASVSAGFVSSNDGSHVALGRALVLRHEASITPEVGLTLWTDYANRGGADYSDRPPGTAFAALPALWLGDQIDPSWGEETLGRLREGSATRELDELVVVRPATDRYISTYGKRRLQHGTPSPNLIALQGTALLVGIHAATMGALGLLALLLLLRRRGVDSLGQLFISLGVGLGTLWGPYSTMLFSHVTTGAMLMWCVWGLEVSREADRAAQRWLGGLVAGFTGAWAASADYAVVVVVVPMVLVVGSWREAWRVVLGAVPVLVLTAAYHHIAFGSVVSIGYDHHATFSFATSRVATFSGNPLEGLWVLWGAGHGAGALVMAPLLLVCAAGLCAERRVGLSVLPWVVLTSFHRTPTGGAGEDHRYLVPITALLGLGLGAVWSWSGSCSSGARRTLRAALVTLALLSAGLVWRHFFAWRG